MDYEEALLQVTDVLKANNRYRLGDFEQAVTLIREIVTPKGKWIRSYDDFYVCSLCGRGICTDWETEPYKQYPFCHCGARMER